MKNILLFAALFVGVLASPAYGQQGAAATAEHASVQDYYDVWTPKQWNGLRSQLLGSLKRSVDAVDPKVLQNVIYFATHYHGEIDLEQAAPRLLEIYEGHPEPAVRMLALTSLHAVAEPQSMRRLARIIKFEEERTVRHVGTAAVVDYYKSQGASR